MVHSNEVVQRDYHYLGMGKIVDSPVDVMDQPEGSVFLQVLAVETLASSLVKVGQIVSWPKLHLAYPLSRKPRALRRHLMLVPNHSNHTMMTE